MRALIILGLTGALLLTAAPAQACTGADKTVRKATLKSARTTFLCLINDERSARGLKALKPAPVLAGLARRFARQMRRENFFGHTTPAGVTRAQRFKRAGYDHHGGENLGYGYATPRRMVEEWMKSTVHVRNILSKRWRYAGFGIALGGSRDRLYVMEFGPARS